MSLSIDSRLVSGIYAFDRWFDCVVGSVCVDAYEFVVHHETFPVGDSDYSREATVYQMADAYSDLPNDNGCGSYGPNSRKSYASPKACNGIQFQEMGTGALVSFPLLEVKAFRSRPVDEYRGQVL
jgi:hypothetical protein